MRIVHTRYNRSKELLVITEMCQRCRDLYIVNPESKKYHEEERCKKFKQKRSGTE